MNKKFFWDIPWILSEIRTYRQVLITISLSIFYSLYISVFQFFSSCEKYEWFSTVLLILVKPIQKSIKMIFPDVFRESVMCLSGEFLHEWLFTHDTIVSFPPELKKWPAELGYKATSLANVNNTDLFPSQGGGIWKNTLSPLYTGLPLLRVNFTADYQQNASARTDDARKVLKKDSESA